MKEQELTLILVDLMTRLTLALETIADAVASHAEVLSSQVEVFAETNDEVTE